MFGGIGDIIGGPPQAVLSQVGSLAGGSFAPGNFKFFSIGEIGAALVAGIGLLNQSMDGELNAVHIPSDAYTGAVRAGRRSESWLIIAGKADVVGILSWVNWALVD